MNGVLTDNVSLATKLNLRRWLLDRMGLTSLRVLDTCSGAGHVWRAMGERYPLDLWTRCDREPRDAGTLRIQAVDAVRTLPLDPYNVIDIDPYGEPWVIYLEMLKRWAAQPSPQPLAVFLTYGHISHFKCVSKAALGLAGVPWSWRDQMPRSVELLEYLGRRLLGETCRYARVQQAATVAPSTRVTYYALALHPQPSSPRRAARS